MDLPALIKDLDQLIVRHPRWGVALAVRGEAKAELAMQHRSTDLFLSAASDVDMADEYLPHNPFVLAAGMYVYTHIMQLERSLGSNGVTEMSRVERRAEQIAAALDEWPNHLEARMRRLLYYRLIGEDGKYHTDYDDLLRKGMGWPQPSLATLLQDDDLSKLKRFVSENSTAPAAPIALAIRYAVDQTRRRLNC